MKKLACILAVLALAGCAKRDQSPQFVTTNSMSTVEAYIDPETGCQYLSGDVASPLTPRIAADGKTHLGCKGKAP